MALTKKEILFIIVNIPLAFIVFDGVSLSLIFLFDWYFPLYNILLAFFVGIIVDVAILKILKMFNTSICLISLMELFIIFFIIFYYLNYIATF